MNTASRVIRGVQCIRSIGTQRKHSETCSVIQNAETPGSLQYAVHVSNVGTTNIKRKSCSLNPLDDDRGSKLCQENLNIL